STPITIGNWDDPRIHITHDQMADVPAGSKLVFYIEPANDTQLQINDCNWTAYTTLEPAAGATQCELTLTAEALEFFSKVDEWGTPNAIIVQGKNCTVNKITIEWEISLETTVWEGEVNIDGWGGMQELAWNQDFIDNTIKTWNAGQTLRVYYNSNGDTPKIKFGRGADWSGLPGAIAQSGDAEGYFSGATGNNQSVALTLTQDDLDVMINNNGLILQGNNCVLIRITIE
ncbi:MAG: hypothetical protein K2F77_07665, partial [Muribaculaceae bacterium]|nr:hypothetical protein [Muribaculaceae bacterium]